MEDHVVKPEDYYFIKFVEQDDWDEDEDIDATRTTFGIVKKFYFDKTGYLDDSYDRDLKSLLPEGFGECEESIFEYDGDPVVGTNALIAAGFTETTAKWSK